MPRTEQIFSKVRRNLHKISERDIKDRLVYQTMQEAQKQIIMLTQCLEKEITLVTVEDQESYDLVYSVTIGEDVKTYDIVGEIKSHKLPSTYSVPELDFITKEEYDQLANIDYETAQPLKACRFNRQLYLFPIPNTAGDIIYLSVYLDDSISQISDSTSTTKVQPEIQNYWDKAIEYYTTSELVDVEEKEYWMNKFEKEIAKFEGKPHAKHQYPIIPDCNW
jgi:hypothetical protein